MRTCLFSLTETDLRTPLRAGATDQDLADLWTGHSIGRADFQQPDRTMSTIGG